MERANNMETPPQIEKPCEMGGRARHWMLFTVKEPTIERCTGKPVGSLLSFMHDTPSGREKSKCWGKPDAWPTKNEHIIYKGSYHCFKY